MIARDKKLHFLAGFGLALVFGHLFGVWIGLGAAAVYGVGKELYDMTGRGTPEFMDFVFTLGGGIVGALIIYGT